MRIRFVSGVMWMLMCLTLGQVLAAVPAVDRLSDLPLVFESYGNGGFVGRIGPVILRLSATGAALGAHGFHLLGVNPAAPGAGETPLAGKNHYFPGSDRRQWRTNVATYGRVRFRGIYPGVDIVYYGKGRELEFDFVVAPGADPGRIQLSCSGGFCGALREPVIYQEKAGNRRRVPGRFSRRGDRLAFAIGKWDRALPLVIDPVLSFASLIGGGDTDSGSAVAVDGAGFIYVLGSTSSGNFPLAGEYQSSLPVGRPHLFVAKLNPGATALVYSTYLGGSGDEIPAGIAIDVTGAAYVGGATTSQDFPLTAAGAITSPSGAQVFAAKLAPDGGLLYSTFVGPDGDGGAIAVDQAGNAYLAHGLSVSKLDTTGKEAYATLLGAAASRVAVDDAGNVYAAGSTSVTTLATRNAFQNENLGQTNAFVAKLDGQGNVAYATYFGGSATDTAAALAVAADGSAYIAGTTTSSDLRASGTLQARPAVAVAYKSTDGAASWNRSDFGLPSGAVFAADPANAATLYALAGQRLYKTTDSGANWRLVLRDSSAGAFAISPSSPLTLYVSASNGPMTAFLRSRDGGATWETFPAPSFRLLAVDPRDPLTVYGGVGGQRDGDGVYTSTDGGVTWNATVLVGQSNGVHSLTVTSAAAYAVSGSSNGLFISRDGGITWAPTDYSFDSVVADPVDPSILYGLSAGILKSTDGGNSFSRLAGSPNVSALVISPSDPTTLYAGTFNIKLYKSTDSGEHWDVVTGPPVASLIGLAVDAGKPSEVYLSTSGGADGFVAKLSPSGSEVVYATYLGGRGTDSISALALGTDGSAYITGTSNAPDFPVLAPFRSSGRAAGTDGFVSRLSADFTSLLWSGFLGGASPTAIAVAPGGGVYVTGSSSAASFPTAGSLQPFAGATAIYRSSDAGAHWIGETPIGVKNVTFLATHPTISSRVLAVADGNLLLSSDAGASWNRVAGDGTMTGLVFDPTQPATAYAAGNTLLLTTNGGLNWSTINSRFNSVVSLAIHPTRPATLYAAAGGQIYRSPNRGADWASTLSGNYRIVRVDPRTAALYAAGGPSIMRSTDEGATWSSIGPTLPDGTTVLEFQIDPNNPSTLYAGVTTGILRSSDGGRSWGSIGQTLPANSGVATLAFDKLHAGTLYAAVAGRGVYRSNDRGDTWSLLPLGPSRVQALAVDPGNGVRIYAGALLNPSDAFVARIEE